MKKIISVHLGGQIFQMEEDAHDYLASLLACRSDRVEMEGRIARELSSAAVVTLEEVLRALSHLGYTNIPPRSGMNDFNFRNLYRSPSDKVIGGVCGGLGTYSGIDPVLIRVLFVLGFFFGFGLLLYLVLWIIIPLRPQLIA